VAQGRFKDNPNYLPRFYTDANFAAVRDIAAACDAHGMDMVQATYTWLMSASALQPGDGVLVGASSVEQLDSNLEVRKCVTLGMDGLWGGGRGEKVGKGQDGVAVRREGESRLVWTTHSALPLCHSATLPLCHSATLPLCPVISLAISLAPSFTSLRCYRMPLYTPNCPPN
jgi:hypothetical protein